MRQFSESGFLNVFKPVGMTSHDAVAYVRRALGRPKTGHAGTLDPAACGVLVLLINGATKLSSLAMACEKTYRAEMTFGLRTDTGDAQGEVVEERPGAVAIEQLQNALPRFMGKIEQVPPMTSAIKIDGKKLYELARKGKEIERPPRAVTVHSIEIIDFEPAPDFPRAVIEVKCSSGLYIRALVEDIAASLGSVAHTSFLIRSAVGPFAIEDSVVPGAVTMESAEARLRPMDLLK